MDAKTQWLVIIVIVGLAYVTYEYEGITTQVKTGLWVVAIVVLGFWLSSIPHVHHSKGYNEYHCTPNEIMGQEC